MAVNENKRKEMDAAESIKHRYIQKKINKERERPTTTSTLMTGTKAGTVGYVLYYPKQDWDVDTWGTVVDVPGLEDE